MQIHICKNPDCKNYLTHLVDDLDHDEDCFWCSECGKTSAMLEVKTPEFDTMQFLLEDAILSRDFYKNQSGEILKQYSKLLDNL